MSQVSIIDIEGNHPQIPTRFNANVGFAIPIANVLEIYSAVTAAGSIPTQTVGSGNRITTNIQTSQAIASTDATKIGLSAFDSTFFSVDANGFVSFLGSAAAESFNIDAHTAPGTDPVVPNGSGVVTVTGGQVAADTTSNVIQTNSLAANTYTIQIQRSIAKGSPSIGSNGVAHFDSSVFSVDTNGFVSAAGTGLGKTITGNSGGALNPTAGNWNLLGSGSITTVGSGSTLTTQLTGLTNHTVLVGAGTSTITKVGPGSAGQVLQSGGASADPSYSTATYPSTATGTGTILRADGTNWLATTSTYPNTNAVSTLLYASSANVMSALATANNGALVTSASGVPSIGNTLINDFTYTSATAGATRTLTVSNTDNTSASSSALIKAITGGASAGDAFYQATTTTTSWSFGVDNSVTSPTADPFVISQGTVLGTNNIMSAWTNGAINWPLQPYVLATLVTPISNATGDGTAVNVIFDHVISDQNSNFNVSTNVFTAPVTGKFLFTGALSLNGILNTHTSYDCVLIGSNRNLRGALINPFSCAASTTLQFPYAISLDMDAADTANIRLTVSNGTKVIILQGSGVTAAYNHMSIYQEV